jgi:hypothetical protein
VGGLIVLVLFIAAWVALDALALRVGVDSRPLSSDPRKPSGTLSV